MKFTAEQIEFLEDNIDMVGLNVISVSNYIKVDVLGSVKGNVRGTIKGNLRGTIKGTPFWYSEGEER